MEAYQLQEHAKQLNDFAAAMIELEAMKAMNKEREIRGESIAYTEADFMELLNTYNLGYNANHEKALRFFP